MSVEIDSPAIEDLGPISSSLEDMLTEVSIEVANNPDFIEEGRLSRRSDLGEVSFINMKLLALAGKVGEEFLGGPPPIESIALVSVVTDADTYNEHTRDTKAASHWHQDFIETDTGFYSTPEGATRLIIPMIEGPLYAVGRIGVINAVKIEAVESPKTPDRQAALAAGASVLGADGVLMKSEEDPRGGDIHKAMPGRAYIIPSSSVHKSPVKLPEGRVFFQLDIPTPDLTRAGELQVVHDFIISGTGKPPQPAVLRSTEKPGMYNIGNSVFGTRLVRIAELQDQQAQDGAVDHHRV